MTRDRDENGVCVSGVDYDLRNLLAVAQTEMRPGPSRICRFVDAVADGQVGTLQTFTTSHINNVWIRWGHGNRADRARRLIVEDWIPRLAIIIGLPHAPVDLRDVKNVRLRRHTGYCARTPAAKRADAAPGQRLEQLGA